MNGLFAVALAAMSMLTPADKYVVRGNVEGYKGEVKLMAHKSNECFAETTTENGKFELVVDVDAPIYANLTLGDKAQMIFVEEGEVVVSGKVGELNVKGTPANDANAAYKKKMESLMSAYVSATSESEKAKAEAAYDAGVVDSYKENKGNIFGLYLLATQVYYTMTPDEILEAVVALPASLKTSHAAKTLKAHAEGMKRVDVGQKYIDLNLPDKDGKMIKLSEVLAKNKYVLLDFWASWCGPCMREVPFLLEDYAKYHDKGFEIYGVSLDRSRDPWVKTMDIRGLVWPNVSELQYWNDASAKTYAVRSIPSNFLIASDGTIVARNLRGEELGAKLAELLGE